MRRNPSRAPGPERNPSYVHIASGPVAQFNPHARPPFLGGCAARSGPARRASHGPTQADGPGRWPCLARRKVGLTAVVRRSARGPPSNARTAHECRLRPEARLARPALQPGGGAPRTGLRADRLASPPRRRAPDDVTQPTSRPGQGPGIARPSGRRRQEPPGRRSHRPAKAPAGKGVPVEPGHGAPPAARPVPQPTPAGPPGRRPAAGQPFGPSGDGFPSPVAVTPPACARVAPAPAPTQVVEHI